MESTSWQVPRSNALLWRQWNGNFVVFNPASGDTHFLNALAGAILQLLESDALTLEQIVSHLQDVSDEPLGDELVDEIHHLVAKFDTVGLIEPAHP